MSTRQAVVGGEGRWADDVVLKRGVSTLLGSLPEEGRGDGGAGEGATRWMGGALLAGFALMML